MATTLTKDDFYQAMCDVRKAHRLIYAYQSKMLGLTDFIKSKFDFPIYRGYPLFGEPFLKKRNYYGFTICDAWGFLYSYVFEYHFGEKKYPKICAIKLSVIQVSDTGYFDAEISDEEDLTTFASEKTSLSKFIFVIEKKNIRKNYSWVNEDWIIKKIYHDPAIMSKNHTHTCLNDKENVQIIYSLPLDRFINEKTTIEALEEFVKFCNENGIQELEFSETLCNS